MCGAVGAGVTVTVAGIGAAVLGASSGWVVWAVVQLPFGFAIGAMAWLAWRIVDRAARGKTRHAPLIAAGAGAVTQFVLWMLYWVDSAWQRAPLVHILALAFSTLATFLILRMASPRGVESSP
ncbi:hypothetical protein ASD93_03630 [Microbacterium sp. Root180]|nr:hypothetical protein ASD93_03630 [Microbacterium sp. Root180]